MPYFSNVRFEVLLNTMIFLIKKPDIRSGFVLIINYFLAGFNIIGHQGIGVPDIKYTIVNDRVSPERIT